MLVPFVKRKRLHKSEYLPVFDVKVFHNSVCFDF